MTQSRQISSNLLERKMLLKTYHRYQFVSAELLNEKFISIYLSNVTQKQTKSNNHISHTNYDFHLDDILQKIVFQKYQQSQNVFLFLPILVLYIYVPHVWSVGINFKN